MKVKVNRQEWNSLSEGDQALIGRVIGGYFKGTEVVPEVDVEKSGGIGGTVGSFCEVACDLAQAAAEGACQSIGDPVGKAVCLAAAKSAGDLCRSQC